MYLSPFKWLNSVSKWRRHLHASYDMLLIGLRWKISGKIGLIKVSRSMNFFCCIYQVHFMMKRLIDSRTWLDSIWWRQQRWKMFNRNFTLWIRLVRMWIKTRVCQKPDWFMWTTKYSVRKSYNLPDWSVCGPSSTMFCLH